MSHIFPRTEFISDPINSIRNHPIKQGLFLFLLRKRREIVLQWKK
uniref:ORF44a n=1 Tax=Pinus thunbergii TaxID=3350 RepID=Q32935_PINTH|nr:ORF44a [Pinus thunbergii]BAA04330.1 ORF44a [Pinus thunbergii]